MADDKVPPWGVGEDPVQWGLRTGRLVAGSVAKWRADLAADRASAEYWLARLYPVMGDQSEQRIAAAASRRGGDAAAARSSTGRAYAVNPLLDSLSSRAYAGAAATGTPPPTLFASGDLPPFTASGVPPEALLGVPWQARHPIATALTRAEAFHLLETFADQPESAAMSFDRLPANEAYAQRVRQWVVDNADDDTIEVELFGQEYVDEARAAESADRSQRRAVAAARLRAIDSEG